ncbi:DUF433 domain-containing protein [Candidatus Poribacteria bacterium]|nr:DUF433 domain-containing protein [Candidatus Poribacteria bacterium]
MAVKTKSATRHAPANRRKRAEKPVVAANPHNGEATWLGKYIEANPRVQGGEPIFKGSRIMVRDALELLANGYTLDDIPRMWCSGKMTREAVVEAIRLATAALSQVHTTPPSNDEEA